MATKVQKSHSEELSKQIPSAGMLRSEGDMSGKSHRGFRHRAGP